MTTTRVHRVGADPGRDEGVVEAAGLLRAGELVAFPTETVYGLGADATSPEAVQRVFDAKGRPADNPLIVHVADASELERACESVDDRARRLAAAFWPGPLTLVLPARPELRRAACRGLDTVAVRVPNHPVALALLRASGLAVAAPSANRSGRPSPTRAEDVLRDLGGRIPLILDGGPCAIGLESTVLDLVGAPVVLRPGAISAEALSRVLGEPVSAGSDAARAHRSPGTRYQHYAPRAPVVLLARELPDATAAELARRLSSGGRRVGYLGRRQAVAGVPGLAVSPARTTEDLARGLYAALRDLDDAGACAILADAVPLEGLGVALMDRLARAASHVVSDEDTASAVAGLLDGA